VGGQQMMRKLTTRQGGNIAMDHETALIDASVVPSKREP